MFRHLDKKVVAAISSLATICGWNQPHRGYRFYRASALTKAFILYYVRQMKSLDDLSSYLQEDNGARRACGFTEATPSRSTLSRFRRTVGSAYFEKLYFSILKILKDRGLLTGRIMAIDSTDIKARSSRKGEEKPEWLMGKSCDFARVGRTPDGFRLGYRLQLAVMTRYEMPVGAAVFPGNHSDYRGLEPAIRHSQPFVTPAVITADGGYFSKYHCNLLARLPAMCLIRSAKDRRKKKHKKPPKPKKHKVPDDDPSHRLIDGSDTFRKHYKKRMSVECVFGRLKEHFMLERPRVRQEDPVKQHVFLSLCALILVALATENLGYGPLKASIFRL